MKITLSRSLGGHDKGDTINVINSVGERLIERGVAEQTDTKNADSDTPKRTRPTKSTTTEADKSDEGAGGRPLPPA